MTNTSRPANPGSDSAPPAVDTTVVDKIRRLLTGGAGRSGFW